MTDCHSCGMRDDDWFLCKRENCPVKEPRGCPTPGACSAILEIDFLKSEIERLKTALRKIMEEGTNSDMIQIGDMYSEDGWEERESVHPLSVIAKKALSMRNKE